jgi:hypothetical protein
MPITHTPGRKQMLREVHHEPSVEGSLWGSLGRRGRYLTSGCVPQSEVPSAPPCTTWVRATVFALCRPEHPHARDCG